MKVEELLKKLDTISPALGAHGLLPIMTHNWFMGTHLLAYNETLGIQIPCKTSFKGAVPKELAQLLRATNPSATIELVEEGGVCNVRTGRKNAAFKYLTLDDMGEAFNMPKPAKKSVAEVSLASFRRALDTCLLSLSNDTSRGDYRGITLIPRKDKLTFFSTNNMAMSRTEMPLTNTGTLTSRVVLPKEFCIEFLELTKDFTDKEKQKEVHFEVNKKYALAAAGDVLLYGAVIEVDQPLDFENIFATNFPKDADPTLLDDKQHAEFKSMVERAMVVTDSDVDQTSAELWVDDGVLHFNSTSQRGEVADQMNFDHADVKPFKLQPKFLSVALDYYDQVTLTRKAVALTKTKSKRVYIISTTS